MTVETYQELFCYTAFPVFVIARDTNNIVYKNLACEQYFPGLCKKHLTKLHFLSRDSRKIGPVLFSGFDVYHTAVALEDEDNLVFLFLNYFQYKQGSYYAHQSFCDFGASLTDFLAAMQRSKCEATSVSKLSDSRLNLTAEALTMPWDENNSLLSIKASLHQVAECVCKKMNSAFSDLGYRIHAHVSEDFPRYLETSVPLQEIFFILGRLLYLHMKLSKTKDVELFLSCDLASSHHVFQIKSSTDLTRLPDAPNADERWLWEFVPECAIEYLFLRDSGFLNQYNFNGKLDSFGNLTLWYRVPYFSPEALYVRSVDRENPFLLRAIDYMLESIRAKLTDSVAFC
jgi:hypothetical protein